MSEAYELLQSACVIRILRFSSVHEITPPFVPQPFQSRVDKIGFAFADFCFCVTCGQIVSPARFAY